MQNKNLGVFIFSVLSSLLISFIILLLLKHEMQDVHSEEKSKETDIYMEDSNTLNEGCNITNIQVVDAYGKVRDEFSTGDGSDPGDYNYIWASIENCPATYALAIITATDRKGNKKHYPSEEMINKFPPLEKKVMLWKVSKGTIYKQKKNEPIVITAKNKSELDRILRSLQQKGEIHPNWNPYLYAGLGTVFDISVIIPEESAEY